MTPEATVPRLRYVDTEDRAWQSRMQEPETQLVIQNWLLAKQETDWPDQILLADLPQVPEEQIDAPIEEIIGRCSGAIRDTGEVTIERKQSSTIFKRPKSTKFVRVIRHGAELMERWDPKKHGEWDKIPDTGITPTQLIEQLYGFGDSEIEHGQQFQKIRKRRASKTRWPASRHPKPHRIRSNKT